MGRLAIFAPVWRGFSGLFSSQIWPGESGESGEIALIWRVFGGGFSGLFSSQQAWREWGKWPDLRLFRGGFSGLFSSQLAYRERGETRETGQICAYLEGHSPSCSQAKLGLENMGKVGKIASFMRI